MKKTLLLFAIILLSYHCFSQVSRAQVEADINTNIYQNSSHQITGSILNTILKEINNSAYNIITDAVVAYTVTPPLALVGTNISITQADASHNGYLLATHWNLFNNKQDQIIAGSGITIVGNTISVTGGGAGTVSSVTVTPGYDVTGVVSNSTTTPAMALTIGALKVVNSMIAYSTIDLTTKVVGILPLANGGHASSTANGGFNNLAPSQVGNAGKFLTTNGTNTSWAAASGGGGSAVTITNDNSTDARYYPAWLTSNTGTVTVINVADQKFTFNPSNGHIGLNTYTTVLTDDLTFGGTSARSIGMLTNTVSATQGPQFTIHGSGATLGGTNLNGGGVTIATGTSQGNGTAPLTFQTTSAGSTGTGTNNPTTKMTITGSGRVGIGTISPNAMLSVGSSSQFQVDTFGNIIKIRNVTSSWPTSNSAGVLTNDGSGTLTWASAGGSGWAKTGDAGTTAGTNFIGTTDNIDFVTKTNNIERWRVTKNGYLTNGGATAITSKLYSEGTGSLNGGVFVADSVYAGKFTSNAGGINIINSGLSGASINATSLGKGFVSYSDETGVDISSLKTVGSFKQIGLLAANTSSTTPTLSVEKDYLLNGFTATSPVLWVNDNTTATGDLISGNRNGTNLFKVSSTGSVTINDGSASTGYVLTSTNSSGVAHWAAASGGGGSAVTITNDNSTDAINYPAWLTTNTGTVSVIKVADQKFAFNPSNGRMGLNTYTTTLTDDITLGGTSARSIGMLTNTVSATQGQQFTIHGSGATSGGTDLNGGGVTIATGTSQGNGIAALTFQTTSAGSTGTGTNSATTKMTIAGSGRVGIGTISPGAILDISVVSGSLGLKITNSSISNTTGWFMYPQTNGAESDMLIGQKTSGGAFNDYMTFRSGGNIGIGVSSPTAKLHLAAGSATAGTAPEKYTSGTLMTTAEASAKEYDGSHYLTNSSAIRFSQGGTIKDFISTVTTSLSTETDLYSYTTPVSTLINNGDKLVAEYGGTETGSIGTIYRAYFAGNDLSNSTMYNGGSYWHMKVIIIKTGSTTAHSTLITLNGSSSMVVEKDLTGITFTNTNILKTTSISNTDIITANYGTIDLKPAAK